MAQELGIVTPPPLLDLVGTTFNARKKAPPLSPQKHFIVVISDVIDRINDVISGVIRDVIGFIISDIIGDVISTSSVVS